MSRDMFKTEKRRAVKHHHCSCGAVIYPGEKYLRAFRVEEKVPSYGLLKIKGHNHDLDESFYDIDFIQGDDEDEPY